MSLSLDSPVQFVKGIGPRKAEALAKHGINTVSDLLGYYPRGYLDRSNTIEIGKVAKDVVVTVVGRVLAQGSMYGGKNRRFEIVLGDETGNISLLWFRAPKYLEGRFKKGDLLAATGLVTYYNGYQLVHPEIEPLEDESAEGVHTGRIVPLYPSTSELTKLGLHSRGFRRSIKYALDNCSEQFIDHLPESLIKQMSLPPLNESIPQIHFPDSAESRERARRRLAFDELSELQFTVLRHKQKVAKIKKAHPLKKHGDLVKKFADSLPYKLTEGQRAALKEIYSDMAGDTPMNRLLQGDVGCGKTVVAIAAAVYAAENNLQTAFMAPTELLAEQHYRNWQKSLEKIGVTCALLTGSLKSTERGLVQSRISSGDTLVVFGTHALLSESVTFKRLGLVIIDEQHRFGVAQRSQLIEKGASPDTLVMSATPIPRTLALTLYGDLDFATIRGLPPGRQPVKTVWRMGNDRENVYKFIAQRVAEKEQGFIIYPLVQRSDNVELQAAEDAYRELSEQIFPKLKLALVHGQMKVEQQEKRIRDFCNGKIDLLVATTVVEVGVDIPGATMMVIEHAERFGLSQLHQLRGRVGRGTKAGYCVGISMPPVSEMASKRLNYFAGHSDGFELAEADLQLRGPGEIFGFRQSGALNFRVANLGSDLDLLEAARSWIGSLVDSDSSGPDKAGCVEYYAARSALRERIAAVA